VATYVGAAYALGQKPKLDPTRSDFLTVKIDGTNVGFGGPFYSVVRTLAESAQNPGDLDKFSMRNPLLRWARGRFSPVLGLLTDLGTQADFLGRSLKSPEEIAKHVATSVLPFGAQTLVKEGPTPAGAQFFGLRAFKADSDAVNQFFRIRQVYNPEWGDFNPTPDDLRQTRDLTKKVDQRIDELFAKHGAFEVNYDYGYREVGEKEGYSDKVITLALAMRSSTFREENRNPDYFEFIAQNEEALRNDDRTSWLFENRDLLDYIARRRDYLEMHPEYEVIPVRPSDEEEPKHRGMSRIRPR